jgi:hypothetical protein
MVNDASRRSHDFKDELRGKPEWVGVDASERLSFTCLGKASRGKPRPKPESGNPTFRDCRGARGNVTLSIVTKGARLGSIPTLPLQVYEVAQPRQQGICLQSRSSGVQFSPPPPEFCAGVAQLEELGPRKSVIGVRIAAPAPLV